MRAESPTSSEPRATPWVPCSQSLRPVRAKVKANRSPILLPLQGVGVYTLIPRALPWAEDWLPFQGARGEGCGARCPCKGLISRILLRGKPRQRYAPLTGAEARIDELRREIGASPYPGIFAPFRGNPRTIFTAQGRPEFR